MTNITNVDPEECLRSFELTNSTLVAYATVFSMATSTGAVIFNGSLFVMLMSVTTIDSIVKGNFRIVFLNLKLEIPTSTISFHEFVTFPAILMQTAMLFVLTRCDGVLRAVDELVQRYDNEEPCG